MDRLIDQVTESVKQRLLEGGLKPTSSIVKQRSSTAFRKADHKPISQWMKADPKNNMAAYIDHTLLKPDANNEQLKKLCQEAMEYKFVAESLKNSEVLPIAVVGFPLGAGSTKAKAFEAKEAIEVGAKEIDMVISIGALRDKNYEQVVYDIAKVVESSKPYPVKVILETAMLSEEEKIIACVLSKIAGAAFVKTSTGFGPGGATVEDIKLMRKIVGPDMGVKASGGVRNYKDAMKMIEAGATRIGTSNGISIVTKKGSKTYGY
jgi:deoxyribose-phosphate aldolase